jgi:hypothetical protein
MKFRAGARLTLSRVNGHFVIEPENQDRRVAGGDQNQKPRQTQKRLSNPAAPVLATAVLRAVRITSVEKCALRRYAGRH